jgi:nicotinate-nucleotide pyrophosphorylase
MYLKSIITCLSFFFLAFTLTAANITVSGYVKDGESKQPLEGVVVTLESTAATTVTDSKGLLFFMMLQKGNNPFLSAWMGTSP